MNCTHLKANPGPAVLLRYRLHGRVELLFEYVAFEVESDAPGVVLDPSVEVHDDLEMSRMVAVLLRGLRVRERKLNLVLPLRLELLGAGEIGLEQTAKLLRHLVVRSGMRNVPEPDEPKHTSCENPERAGRVVRLGPMLVRPETSEGREIGNTSGGMGINKTSEDDKTSEINKMDAGRRSNKREIGMD